MTAKNILITGGIFGALAVVIGAFGAHGLREVLIENGRTEAFETAVKYQFYHTLALLVIGVLNLEAKNKLFSYAAYAMLTGIIIFSGSLYVLCITNITILGAITPVGGLMFIVGWLFFIFGVKRLL